MNDAQMNALVDGIMVGIAPVLRALAKQTEDRLSVRLAAIEKRFTAELPALLELRRDLEKGFDEVNSGLPSQIERFVEAAIGGEASVVCRIARTEIASFDKEAGDYVPTGVVSAVVEAEVRRQIDALPARAVELDRATIREIISEEVAKAAPMVPTAEEVVALMHK